MLFTVFAMGGTTAPVLRRLGIETGVEDAGGAGAARARDAASKNALLRALNMPFIREEGDEKQAA